MLKRADTYTLDDLDLGAFARSFDVGTPQFDNAFDNGVGTGTIVSGETGQSTTIGDGGNMKSGQTNYDTGVGFWIGNSAGVPRMSIGDSGGNKMTWDGSTLTIVGTLTATTGLIGGWTIGADEIYSGNVHLKSTAQQLLFGSATSPTTGTGVFLGKDGSDYKFRVGNPAGGQLFWTGTDLVFNGALITGLASGSDLALSAWQLSCVFSSTNFQTVAWTAGTLTFSNGVSYPISSGTVVPAATTYIYFDSAVSTSTFQTTTTAASAIGANKILIGVVAPNSDTGKFATYQIFGGTGGVKQIVTADDIAAGSITANEIAANTITAAELATSLLYAGEIILDTQGHVMGGQTGFDTGVGFFLGYAGGAYKFSIGDSSSDSLTWDGVNLRIKGNLELSSVFNLLSYTVATLPQPPITDGPHAPTVSI